MGLQCWFQKQYVFLHEAVLEALMYTTSGIPTAEFVNIFRQLMESKEGQMQLEQEYEVNHIEYLAELTNIFKNIKIYLVFIFHKYYNSILL